MNDNQNVLWQEGMFLLPHHFQQWERHHTQRLSQHLQLTSPLAWGCQNIEIDVDGLANGSFSLLNLKGIMPDGVLIQIPAQDPSPPTRPIGSLFTPEMDHLDVYLALAEERPGSANVSLGDETEKRPTRYIAIEKKVMDFNTGENPKEISLSHLNWKIFFSGENITDHMTLKIAELIRTPGGTLALRDSYIPPCTLICAAPFLMRMVRGLMDVLSAKCDALADVRRAAAVLDPVNPVKLLMLSKMNEALPFLAHAADRGLLHPQQLYLMLSQLAGALATFYPDIRIQDLPPYQHQDLQASFCELEKKIRLMTGEVTETSSTSIPLEQSRPNVWLGQISDERLFQNGQFFLRISGDMPEKTLLETVSRRIKLGAAQELDLIVSSAMPGVRFYFVPRPPSKLPLKAGHFYFRLDENGAFWDSVARSRSIAFYIPADLLALRIELIVIET